jgi:hypothetical protein
MYPEDTFVLVTSIIVPQVIETPTTQTNAREGEVLI